MNQRAPVVNASFTQARSGHGRAASHINQPPRVRGRTTIASALVLGLVLGGLLLCSNARAVIALQDGSTAMTFSTGSTSVSKNNFTVTSGASVLVVLLVDRNNSSANSGPASLTWNGGAAQTITRIASTNGAASTWAWDNVYYLFNPTPGTATITATDSSGATPSMMAIAAFTLSGVDANVTPVPYASGVQPVNNLTVALGAGTPAFGWAVVSSSYGTTTGNGWQLSASGGPLTWSYGNTTIQEGMGYVGPLNPGSSTVTGRDASGGTQKIGISIAV